MNVYKIAYTKIPLHDNGTKIERGPGSDAACNVLAESGNAASADAMTILGSPSTEIHVQSVIEVATNVLSAPAIEPPPDEAEKEMPDDSEPR